MRRLLISLLLLGSLSAAFAGDAVTGRVIKVLPFFLDLKGQNALSPSLYDRDAYQAYLLRRPGQRSAIRFDVLWKASNVGGANLKLRAELRSAIRFDVLWKTSSAGGANLKLRVELRGIGEGGMPRQAALEQTVAPHFFRHWNSLALGGQDYKNFGELVAWRVTLWSGGQVLSEQKSFLW